MNNTDVNMYQDIKNYLMTAVKAASYHEIQETTGLNDDEMESGINTGLKAKGIEVCKVNGYVRYRIPTKKESIFNPPINPPKSISALTYFQKVELMVANAVNKNPDIGLNELLVKVRMHFPFTTRKVIWIAHQKATGKYRPNKGNPSGRA